MCIHGEATRCARDVNSVDEALDLLARCQVVFEYPLDQLHVASTQSTLNAPSSLSQPSTMGCAEETIDITIHAVLGDTFLSSVAWFHGSKYAPMDLYDCIIVFLEVPRTSHMTTEKPQLLAIPTVRPWGKHAICPPVIQMLKSTGRDAE